MKIVEDLKSGHFATYSQWLAFISLVCTLHIRLADVCDVLTHRSFLPLGPPVAMILVPFLYIGTVSLLFVWSIMTWIMAGLVLLIEFPLLSRFLPESSSLHRATEWTRNLFFRAISHLLYLD